MSETAIKNRKPYSIAHEYVTENIVRLFEKVLEFTPRLKKTIERLNDYCARYLESNK